MRPRAPARNRARRSIPRPRISRARFGPRVQHQARQRERCLRRRAVAATQARTRVEQRYDPIICQGQRLLQIDNQNLAFEGDAITAEGGCEIHITNSHITAGGIGISARGASVHIKNSSIEGDSGSVSASDGAQVYAQSSTFKGLSRRLDTAEMHDLGGNVWN